MPLDHETITRFWSHVTKTTTCWTWGSAKNAKGYGVFSVKTPDGKWKVVLAHRLSWLIENGAIEDGLHVCHRCDTPGCVRPDHLFLATNHENRLDSVRKGRHARGDRSGARRHPERIPRGETNGISKLTESLVREIRRMHSEGMTATEIALHVPVVRRTVQNVIDGDTWKHVA